MSHRRVFGLDALRCAAILFVVIEHGNYLLPPRISALTAAICYDGVSLFFVLSGFLIGGILIREYLAASPPVAFSVLSLFWRRRWYRTLPNYLLMLAVLIIAERLQHGRFRWHELVHFATFTQNFASPHPWWFFPEAWSLSVEEWFYLSIPLLVLLLTRLRVGIPRALLTAAGATIVLVTLLRWHRYAGHEVHNINEWDHLFRKQVVTRLDSLMYGVLAAYAAHFFPSRWTRWRGPAALAGMLLLIVDKYLPGSPLGPYGCIFSFTTAAIGAALLLPACSQWRKADGLLVWPVTTIALISYSMYLVNLSLVQGLILPWLHPLIGDGYRMQYALYWAFVLGISAAIYRYFERPITDLRPREPKT